MKAHAQDGLTWIFSSTSTTVKAHKAGCGMLRTVNPARGIVAVDSPEEKASIIERGFTITVCKCAKHA